MIENLQCVVIMHSGWDSGISFEYLRASSSGHLYHSDYSFRKIVYQSLNNDDTNVL